MDGKEIHQINDWVEAFINGSSNPPEGQFDYDRRHIDSLGTTVVDVPKTRWISKTIDIMKHLKNQYPEVYPLAIIEVSPTIRKGRLPQIFNISLLKNQYTPDNYFYFLPPPEIFIRKDREWSKQDIDEEFGPSVISQSISSQLNTDAYVAAYPDTEEDDCVWRWRRFIIIP